MAGGWIAASVAIVVWGVTFASTRVLLEEFSALEINVLRFALAWAALAAGGMLRRRRGDFRGGAPWWLSAVGGVLIVCGVAVANMKRRDVR